MHVFTIIEIEIVFDSCSYVTQRQQQTCQGKSKHKRLVLYGGEIWLFLNPILYNVLFYYLHVGWFLTHYFPEALKFPESHETL